MCVLSHSWNLQKVLEHSIKHTPGAVGEGGGRGDRDGEDMWTQGLFISMYDKIHYKKKKKTLLFFQWNLTVHKWA